MRRLSPTRRQSLLLRVALILAVLLVLLALVALLYILFQVLQRFGTVVVIFTLGAIFAYMLSPAVNKASALLRRRWAGTLAVYAGVAAAFIILVVMLLQPLVMQSSSLLASINRPSASSLRLLRQTENQARAVENEMRVHRSSASSGRPSTKSRSCNLGADRGLAA